MTKLVGKARFLGSSAALCVGLFAHGAAAAQSGSSTSPTEQALDDEIVVTGSLHSNPEIEQSSPITTIDRGEIDLRQVNNVEELLRSHPGAVADIGSTINNGNQGASFVNLRGLGANRNLVLLDGTRVAPAGLTGAVDLNNVPIALLERVDILTGGASTTYGADAISGVVNFVTRRNFHGIEMSASNQITERGDGRRSRAELVLGTNFAGGRGNAVLSLGYIDTDPVFQGDRSFSVISLNSFSGEPGGFSPTTVPARFGGARGVDGRSNGTFQIDPLTGQLVPSYQLFNFNPQNVYQTPFSRLNAFGAARIELTDSLELYSQGMVSRNQVGTRTASAGTFSAAPRLPLSNPYMPDAARAQFCAFDIDQRPEVYIPRFSAAECAAAALATSPQDPAYRTIAVPISRRFAETGARKSEYRTDWFNLRAGVRGRIGERLQFDLNGAYGESRNEASIVGVATFTRLQQAVLATNKSTCLDPSNGCVPINLFGPLGSVTPDQLDFLLGQNSTKEVTTSLAQVRGLLSGDLGFSIPTSSQPVNVALGAEYRRYRASLASDALSQTQGEILGGAPAIPDVTGGYSVWETFSEVIAPLTEGRPFLNSLQLELGARYSHYSTSGGTFAWKLGSIWEPAAWLKLRGNYQKAVRTPNIGELYEPPSIGFGIVPSDPCAGEAPLAIFRLAAICLAQGAPADVIGFIENPFEGAAKTTTGGNVDLAFETARTWSLGLVASPPLVPGLTVRADYYNTSISNAIVNPSAADVLLRCFGPAFNPGLDVTAGCKAIGRDPFTGSIDADGGGTGIPVFLTNEGVLRTDGLDFGADFRIGIGQVRLSLSVDGNWTRSARIQPSPISLDRECAGYYSENCSSILPKFSFNQRSTIEHGKAAFSLLWRYIGPMRYEPAAMEADIAAATDPDTGEVDQSLIVDDRFARIGARHYFDLSLRFTPKENHSLILSVQNLFDSRPPIVGENVAGTPFNAGNTFPATYDPLGRLYAVSARVRF